MQSIKRNIVFLIRTRNQELLRASRPSFRDLPAHFLSTVSIALAVLSTNTVIPGMLSEMNTIFGMLMAPIDGNLFLRFFAGGVQPDNNGRPKDLYGQDADTWELHPQEPRWLPKQTSAPLSGDAFVWQQTPATSLSNMGQPRGNLHLSSGQPSSFATGASHEVASAPPALTPAPYGVIIFSIAEIMHATQNFSPGNSLGETF